MRGGVRKPIYWLHDGDEEPTRYESHAELAQKLNVTRSNISYYVKRGINSDESRRKAQSAPKGCIAKPCNATPVTYDGVTYPSIKEFCRQSGLTWYSALKTLGKDVLKYSRARKARNMSRLKSKMIATQKLAIKAKGLAE